MRASGPNLEKAVADAEKQQHEKSDEADTDGTDLSERRFIGRNNARTSSDHAESMAIRCFCCKSSRHLIRLVLGVEELETRLNRPGARKRR